MIFNIASTIGIVGADIKYPSFYLSANVGSVDGGTTITLTFPSGGASILTGVTFGGTAGTSLTTVDDNSATVVSPAKSAGTYDVVGAFTGYDSYTVKNGWTAQAGAAAPGDPIISEKYILANKISIDIIPPDGYKDIDVYRNDSLLAEAISTPTNYIDSSVYGSTSYTYYVKARNDTGTSNSSNILSITTLSSTLPIEERIVDGMKSLTEGMLISNGYFYDWSDANKQDQAKIETFPAVISIEGKTEDNTDQNNSVDTLSYSNDMNVEIKCVGKLDSESSNPKNSIRLIINQMLVDLKKLFGTYYYVNDEAETEMIYYVGYEYEDNPSRDVFDPIHLTTKWKVRYRQKRTNPLVNII